VRLWPILLVPVVGGETPSPPAQARGPRSQGNRLPGQHARGLAEQRRDHESRHGVRQSASRLPAARVFSGFRTGARFRRPPGTQRGLRRGARCRDRCACFPRRSLNGSSPWRPACRSSGACKQAAKRRAAKEFADRNGRRSRSEVEADASDGRPGRLDRVFADVGTLLSTSQQRAFINCRLTSSNCVKAPSRSR